MGSYQKGDLTEINSSKKGALTKSSNHIAGGSSFDGGLWMSDAAGTTPFQMTPIFSKRPTSTQTVVLKQTNEAGVQESLPEHKRGSRTEELRIKNSPRIIIELMLRMGRSK